jgi:hypothetical protein
MVEIIYYIFDNLLLIFTIWGLVGLYSLLYVLRDIRVGREYEITIKGALFLIPIAFVCGLGVYVWHLRYSKSLLKENGTP